MTKYTSFEGSEGRDEFERRPIAENIISLLDAGTFTPMVLDGPWGSGKTEFSHKLMSLIEENHDDWQVAYIDAFKADHSDEPLMTLIAAVAKLLPEKGGKREYLKKAALPAIRFGLKTAAKATVAHLTRESFEDVADEYHGAIDKALNKTVDATIESLLQEHVEADKNLEVLQGALRVVAEEAPLILIIDELDRCRPDFAIEILELIKHVFDVPNVQFLLVTNTQQLKAAIKHRYGIDVDAQKYLDKFLKLKVQLSPFVNRATRKQIPAVMVSYKQLLENSPQLASYNGRLPGDIRFKFLQMFLELSSFSLREVETLVRTMEVYDIIGNQALSTNQNPNGHGLFEFLGLILVTFNPKLANSIVENQITSADFYNYFKLGELIRHQDIHTLLLSINKQLPGRNNEVSKTNSADYRAKLAELGVYIEHGLDEPLNLLKRTINLSFLRKAM